MLKHLEHLRLRASPAKSLTLNSGTIEDQVNNVAALTLPNPGAAGSLSANKAIVIGSAGVTQFKSVYTHDGHVLETGENTSAGGSWNAALPTFSLGDDASNRQYRGFLSFNTSALPDNAVVTRVTLKIKQQSLTGTNPFTTHGKLGVDIHKTYFGTMPQLESRDFQAAPSRALVGFIANTPTDGWYVVNLNSTAYSLINTGTGFTQLRLAFATGDDNDRIADIITFYSGNSTAANQPVLVIEYYVP